MRNFYLLKREGKEVVFVLVGKLNTV
jgi:hypothetical protein